MGMVAFKVVAVGILAGVKQQANDLRLSVLHSKRQPVGWVEPFAKPIT
jgi:hypothetical protein